MEPMISSSPITPAPGDYLERSMSDPRESPRARPINLCLFGSVAAILCKILDDAKDALEQGVTLIGETHPHRVYGDQSERVLIDLQDTNRRLKLAISRCKQIKVYS